MDPGIPTFRVCLVEDSPLVLPRLLDVLAGIPGVSVVGDSGRAEVAIAEIAERKPDAIVLDLKLESGSGYDVLAALAQADSPPTVIVLSNYTTELHRLEAARLGAAYFFDKTSEILQMVGALAHLVERRRKQLWGRANGTNSEQSTGDCGGNGGRGLEGP